MTRDTHTYTTCFNDFCCMRLRFEHVHPTFRMRWGYCKVPLHANDNSRDVEYSKTDKTDDI